MTLLDTGVNAVGELIESSFNQENVDIVKVKEIVLAIHALPQKDKIAYEELYKIIGDKLFSNSITLTEYQKDHFKPIAKSEVTSTPPITTGTLDFSTHLKNLIECCHNDLAIESKCVILKFGDDKSTEVFYILLHDTQFKPGVFSTIKTKFGDKCDIYPLDVFINNLETFSKRTDENYIAILLLSSNPNPENTIIPQLNTINGFFSPLQQIHLLKDHKSEHFFTTITNFFDIQAEVKYLVSKELKDIELNNETEKILKKLFGLNTGNTLQYKKMSKGYSGSSVYYIRPSGLTHTQVKFIVKVGETERSIGKIEVEMSNFHKYVDAFTTSYNLKVERTEKCIAIRYNYASKDSKIDSFSFSDSYDKSFDDLSEILKRLFENPLFVEWNAMNRIAQVSFEEYYKSYINLELVKSAISKIKAINVNDVDDLRLLKTFKVICGVKIASFEKICHGDLHSENFFIDSESNVFLIDFGDTDIRHSLIDFTTLECSIKFKHIPNYIDNTELFSIEEELMDFDSFQLGYNFKNLKRLDLMKPYRLINEIRSKAYHQNLVRDTSTQLEYLYSLYMITIRQIQYPSMNQLYAIKSAEILGEKILLLLGLIVEIDGKELITF